MIASRFEKLLLKPVGERELLATLARALGLEWSREPTLPANDLTDSLTETQHPGRRRQSGESPESSSPGPREDGTPRSGCFRRCSRHSRRKTSHYDAIFMDVQMPRWTDSTPRAG